MKPNEIYFERNQGSWDWEMAFKISSYMTLWKSDLRLITKIRLSAFALSQIIIGPFQMWTSVDFQKANQKVYHSTKLSKFRITFYRSEKTFFLEEEGHGIRLEGVEYFWPLNFKAVPFHPVLGSVDKSSIHASYQMPLAGTLCNCQTYLGESEGYMEISTPWLTGRFTLTQNSRRILASRFH